MEEKHNPLIRTIYLYLFALAGLIIVVIAGIRALNLGLKVFVFKDIEKQTRLSRSKPVSTPYLEGLKNAKECEEFTEKEKESIRNWINDYEQWKKDQEEFDYVSAQRQEEASSILAHAAVGLPLYLYHWSVIQKETEEENKQK